MSIGSNARRHLSTPDDVGGLPRIGFVLAGLVSFFNPSAVVVRSGIPGGDDILLNAIRQGIYERSLPASTRSSPPSSEMTQVQWAPPSSLHKDSSEQPARSRKRAPVTHQQGPNRTHDQAWFGANYDRASKSKCPIRFVG